MKLRWMLVLLVLIICTGCGRNEVEEGAVVCVNGEYIYMSEITPVMEQYKKSDITAEEIIENSVIELLVIQQAKSLGVEVADQEVTDTIERFREKEKTYYDKAEKLYTEAELRFKIRSNLLFNKVRNHMLGNVLPTNETVTSEDVEAFITYNNLESHLADYSQEAIIKYLWSDIEDYLFMQWAKGLKDSAEITYY